MRLLDGEATIGGRYQWPSWHRRCRSSDSQCMLYVFSGAKEPSVRSSVHVELRAR
jgi:hypothetical protein